MDYFRDGVNHHYFFVKGYAYSNIDPRVDTCEQTALLKEFVPIPKNPIYKDRVAKLRTEMAGMK
jgi:hypothetical protein